MAPNEEPEVINHGSLVLCDSCNQEMYNDDNFKEGYLLLEVEGYPTQRLLCKDCFERWKGYGKEANDNELKELSTIPSKDGLLTMLAGGMIATVKDLAICLDLYEKKLEK